jgi:hypothetical protein
MEDSVNFQPVDGRPIYWRNYYRKTREEHQAKMTSHGTQTAPNALRRV